MHDDGLPDLRPPGAVMGRKRDSAAGSWRRSRARPATPGSSFSTCSASAGSAATSCSSTRSSAAHRLRYRTASAGLPGSDAGSTAWAAPGRSRWPMAITPASGGGVRSSTSPARPAAQRDGVPDRRGDPGGRSPARLPRHRSRLRPDVARARAARRLRAATTPTSRSARASGATSCTIPTCGLDWMTTAQPVVLTRGPPRRDAAAPAVHERAQLARRVRAR